MLCGKERVKIAVYVAILCPGFTMKSVCLLVFFFLPQKKNTPHLYIITMDVGRESDNNDAVNGFFKEWT